MFSSKLLLAIFIFQVGNVYLSLLDKFKDTQGSMVRLRRNAGNETETKPKIMNLDQFCHNQPNGTGILPVNSKICTRLYLSCDNYTGSLKRCDSMFYMNPETRKCELAAEIETCREFFNITFPTPAVFESDIVDGATSYCRTNENCETFTSCCKSHCMDAGPLCKTVNENLFVKEESFCRCSQQSYLHNPSISEGCLHTSNDCVEFHMCCLLSGCPNIYVECNSTLPEEKPTQGLCYC